MDTDKIIWIAAAIINIPVYLYLGKKFFGSLDGFIDSMEDCGESRFPQFQEEGYTESTPFIAKLFTWLFLCWLIVFLEVRFIDRVAWFN